MSDILQQTGLAGWQVLALASALLLTAISVFIFCVFRFLKKRRTGQAAEEKGGDHQALITAEEEVDIFEEEPLKVGMVYYECSGVETRLHDSYLPL